MAQPLVEEINKYEEVKTVAIAEFTDLDYTTNALGKQLSAEFQTSLVTAKNRSFSIITRKQLEALIAEAKLDADGLLSPDNIPRLGRLKGIDLIIGATISLTHQDTAYLNVEGVKLETGEILVGARGAVTLTPSLKRMLGLSIEEEEKPKAQKEKGIGLWPAHLIPGLHPYLRGREMDSNSDKLRGIAVFLVDAGLIFGALHYNEKRRDATAAYKAETCSYEKALQHYNEAKEYQVKALLFSGFALLVKATDLLPVMRKQKGQTRLELVPANGGISLSYKKKF